MKALASVAVGFAADGAGSGVAFVRTGAARTLRVPFAVKRQPALLDREVGYAALAAVAGALRKRGIDRLEFAIDDPNLAMDLQERRDVPPTLTLAYVRLRCVLNQLAVYRIVAASPSDLTARARGEVAMHIAA